MNLLQVLLWLLSAAGAVSDRAEVVLPPAALNTNLALALSQISYAGACAELHPSLDLNAEFEKRQAAYLAAEEDVQGIWGGAVRPEISSHIDGTKACSTQSVTTALEDADGALAAHNRAYGQATAVMAQGVWFGPMKLCGGLVKRVDLGDDDMLGQPILDIALGGPAAATLAEITTRNVGSALAVRLNGQIVSRPRVHEPLAGGHLAISGPDGATLAAIKRQLAGPC